jgi:hypothetical protein
LLDDSLRPALEYLISGFAGDEVSVEVVKAQWDELRKTVTLLEGEVSSQLALRNKYREFLVGSQEQQAISDANVKSDVINSFMEPWKSNPLTSAEDYLKNDKQTEILEANRKATETRLQYVEAALGDAQDKLGQASNAFQRATKDYASAMQNQYTRHIAIDQLRIHAKQNILYYMQAIWAHEPSDQRFFRLYNKKVICAEAQEGCASSVAPDPMTLRVRSPGGPFEVDFKDICVPTFGGAGVGGHEHDLIEVADLDEPLGYKGNYIIFPLKDKCHLTFFMLSEFIDDYLGVGDPDSSTEFDAKQFDDEWTLAKAQKDATKLDELRSQLVNYVTAVRRSTDEIIVPTGQLFIEALPGSHPLLEDFKLLHRMEDVRKVKAEVRHAELENLRLASRLATGQDNHPELLEDPDIEKKIVVEGNASVLVNPHP